MEWFNTNDENLLKNENGELYHIPSNKMLMDYLKDREINISKCEVSRQKIRYLHSQQGKNYNEIASTFDISVKMVQNIIEGLWNTPRNTKYTSEDKAEIAQYAKTHSQAATARHFKIAQSTVWNILKELGVTSYKKPEIDKDGVRAYAKKYNQVRADRKSVVYYS